MINYKKINNTVQEKGNIGGIWQDVFFAPKSDFAEFAERPSEEGDRDFATMNKLMVGQDRLKPGKRLYPLYSTLEKGSLTAPRQGEIDGISHKPTLKLLNPGLTSEALALLLIPNQDWIFYIRTGEQMFRLGGNQFAAKLAPEGEVGTGDATASLKGNEMIFYTYDVGFAPEVVDINSILAMVNPVDEGLTVVYTPAHGTTGVLVDATPTIAFGEAVINADTLSAFTNQELDNIIKLRELDVDGNVVGEVAFTAVMAANTITVTPSGNLNAATVYELWFDSSKVLSADSKGRVNGAYYMRFTTA